MAIVMTGRMYIGLPFDPGAQVGYFTLYSDEGGYVLLQPEFDYEEKFVKDETRHRSLTGDEFAYTWGHYKKWMFSVKHVDSYTVSFVNTWWRYNHDLKFRWLGNPPQSVRIVNRQQPVSRRHKGRHDLFRGKIELESFE